MKLIKHICICFLFFCSAQAAQAMTFNPSTVGLVALNGQQTCTNSTSGGFDNTTCTGPEGSMSTSASAVGGVLKTGNQSSIDYSAVPGSLFGSFSHAGAGYSDSITVTNGPSSGFLDISLRVQGIGTIAYTGPASNSGSLRLEVFMYKGPGFGATNVNVVNDYTSNMSIDQIFTGRIPYQNSVADFSIFLNTFVSCPGAAAGTGGTCTSSMNFLNSATVVGTQVLDASMNLVTGTTLTAASGFNYATGVTPPVAPVPVPASIPLLASAIALLGFLGFKRRKQSDHSAPIPKLAPAF